MRRNGSIPAAARRSRAVFLLLALIVIAVVAYYLVAAQLEYRRNRIVQEQVERRDLRGIYDYYLTGNVALDAAPFVGSAQAPVTIVAVVDFASDASAREYRNQVPALMEYYIATGQARLYHKYYLPEEEYSQRTGRFIYAAAAACYAAAGGPDPVGFHEALFGAASGDVAQLAGRFNVSQAYGACLAGAGERLYADMMETRTLRLLSPSLRIGLNGRDETVLPGEPSMARINQTIREKQVTIGI